MNYRQWRFWATALALGLLVLAGLFSVWAQKNDAREQIDKLAVANADSAQWSLAQLEVEYQAYRLALLSMAARQGGAAEVRRSFDVFYSRANTLMNAPLYRDVVDLPRVGPAVLRLDDMLNRTAAVIDAGDPAIASALDELLQTALLHHSDVREISLAGVDVFSQESEEQRGNTVNAFVQLETISLGLMLVAILVGVVLMIMFWRARNRSEEITITQSRLRAMISTSIDGILVVNRDGRILDYNGAAEQMFGYTREEAIGNDMDELIIPEELREAHNAGMKRYRETGEKRVTGAGLLTLQAMRKDRTVFPVELSINGAESSEGEIFVSFLRDISKRVKNEEELVEARDKAVAGEKAKANLLAVMSHEMRTPLNGVLGTLQLLAATDLTPRQAGFVDAMTFSGELLVEHVNNVLDISRIDAGKAQISKQVFDLPRLVEGVLESLRGQATDRQNLLKFVPLGDLSETKSGDPARLRQVLVNLVGNAIKFTEQGEINVEVEQLPDGDLVEFRVTDSGIGISEEDLERVFADFVTLDTSYQREVEGTGLGLGITRRLIELMEGEIGVESEPGAGSVFWFHLPLPNAKAKDDNISETVLETSQGKELARSVLVVEDNEINRMVVREMLQIQNCEVTEARDGIEGVELAMTTKFDLILMDISMPKMDGTLASAKIKTTSGPNKDTPIVALTAHALPDDIRRFREAGMVDVMTKPLSRDRLVAVLNNLVEGTNISPTQSGARAELVETLGAEQAAIVIERVRTVITGGLAQLRKIAATADESAVAAIAHKLAGSAALVGCEEVHAHFRNIELNNAAMSAEDLDRELESIVRILAKDLGGEMGVADR